VSGIPAGMNYLVELTAKSTDGATTCTGHANFNVQAGKLTKVTVVLQCTGGTNGSVQVNGIWCPELASYTVSPLTIAVRRQIDVSAMAADIDTTDDATPTFKWSASAGSFVSDSSATTKYNCAAAGSQTITIKVSAHSPTVDVTACADSQSTMVTCVPLSCGN